MRRSRQEMTHRPGEAETAFSPGGMPSPATACGRCGQPCRLVLERLFDTRFGAPGVFAIWQCRGCGLEQTWPRPSADELQELYERYYNAGVAPGGRYQGWRERFLTSPLYRLWLKWDGDISFHSRRGVGRLLDVGCNEGRGLSLYASNGFQVEGLEINQLAAAAARRRGFTVHTRPLKEFAPGAAFDVVVLSNVLEHSLAPWEMLGQVRRLLPPEGQVWVSCPNAASLWRRVFRRSWINWHVPFHLWHFSPETLGILLAQAGFEVQEMHTFTPALWMAQSLCVRLSAGVSQINRLMRSAPVVGGLMVIARLFFLPFFRSLDRKLAGDCLTVVARPAKAQVLCAS